MEPGVIYSSWGMGRRVAQQILAVDFFANLSDGAFERVFAPDRILPATGVARHGGHGILGPGAAANVEPVDQRIAHRYFRQGVFECGLATWVGRRVARLGNQHQDAAPQLGALVEKTHGIECGVDDVAGSGRKFDASQRVGEPAEVRV